MTVTRSSRDLWATLLPAGGALVGLTVVAALMPSIVAGRAGLGGVGPGAMRWLVVALLAVGTASAMHRPFGATTLGLGAVVLAPALFASGVAPAAGIAAVSLLLAEIGLRAIRVAGTDPVPERRQMLRAVEAAGRTALATLLAGVGWWSLAALQPRSPLASRLGLAAFVYLASWVGLDIAERKIRRPEQGLRWRYWMPLAGDAVGWLAGGALTATIAFGDWWTSGVLLAVVAILGAEAGRNGIQLEKARSRIRNLDRLQAASKRMSSTGQEMRDLAERLCFECRRVTDCSWFQFEALTPGSGFGSWWAGPVGVVFEGVPEPDPFPAALPGFHRRLPWQVLERPLRLKDRVLGRLRLWCDPRRVDPEQVELLERLLPQMAVSVQRSLLDRESREDALTGLATRRVLERRLHEVHAEAIETGGAMAVVLCDLDHFKRINDTHGHAAGDAALVAVARVLNETKREQDVSCRYGGEELVILMPGANGEAALALAERLRENVAGTLVESEGTRIPLTMSVGAASFPELYIKTAAELILFADEALYEAKRRGRNRCLLDVGQGRYLDLAGAVHLSEDAPPTVVPPRIFA